MILSKKVLLLSCLIPIFSLANEPSAFGAGDLSSSNPYGLTSSEKVLLETKKNLHKIAVKSNNQENELDSLRERIDGLQSVIESLSRKAQKNKINIQKRNELSTFRYKSSSEYENRLSQSIEEQKVLLKEISSLVYTINKLYVSKKEFNSLVYDVNKLKKLVGKKHKLRVKHTRKSSSSKKSSQVLYNEAARFYKKKYYTKAIANYEILIKRKYKPAFAHYMIGEMYYRRKNYSNAIFYYKKSSSLYSKAPYMPNLMLHTAVSMKRTGDNAHANIFFEAVVAKYPNSAEARDARIFLQR